jgi:arylsulfatase A-like enzyme
MGASPHHWRRAAAALALIALGCSVGEGPRPSVVVVLIDQLRKDAADRYLVGVNALAAQGVVFETMRSAAPWTYPSVISLLSGLYPQQHGADGHQTVNRLAHFDPGVPLLQKRLKAAGYTTAAFVTNPFLMDWNEFHRGFDTFDQHFIRTQGDRRLSVSVFAMPSMFANSVNLALRAHFEGRPPTSPEFTYVHYIDVHGPWASAPFAPDYENAIRFVDGKVVELYEFFRDRYDGDLLFFVTSDHGRALGDDLDVGYGPDWRKQKASVHDYNLRIPFLILPGRRVPRGRRVSGPCSNVDFVPTLLDWLDLPAEHPRPGTSLLPAIRGGEVLPPERPIYARHSAFGDANDGLVRGDLKFVRFFDVATGRVVARRVFDVAKDPRETRSLDGDFPEAEAELEAVSGSGGIAYRGVFRDVDPGIEESLRALGYLGGDRESPSGPSDRPRNGAPDPPEPR